MRACRVQDEDAVEAQFAKLILGLKEQLCMRIVRSGVDTVRQRLIDHPINQQITLAGADLALLLKAGFVKCDSRR